MQAAPKVGSILLGKYRVERVLGQGGMGVVVAARHEALGELYAIKLMQPEVLEFKDARERFVREARASARLKGEHVAHVHDVGTLENGAPYMVMDHLKGQDLKQVLDKRGVLPIDEAALYVLHACEAIAEAHSLGIAHRDLKPANMFLTHRPNGTPCVKVLDFGISKDINAEKVGQGLTKEGMALGTPFYMAPEQLANTKMTDLRSDIWALGIILYELVIGKPPFYAEAMTELIAQVLTNPPVPPSHVRPGIPPEFDALVLRCLEKKADHRYATVRDLMAALLPFTTATTPSLSTRVPGIQEAPVVPREEIKDTTTLEIEKRQELPSSLQPTIVGTPILQNVRFASSPALLEGENAPPVMREQALSRQTGGAWGGTSRIFAKTAKRPQVMIAAALGGVSLLSLIAVVVANVGSSDTHAAPFNATAPESAAPVATPAVLPVEPKETAAPEPEQPKKTVEENPSTNSTTPPTNPSIGKPPIPPSRSSAPRTPKKSKKSGSMPGYGD